MRRPRIGTSSLIKDFIAEEARAHLRLGDINRLMGKDTDAAREYSDSIGRFAELARKNPGRAEYRQALAYAHNWLGETIRGALDRSMTFEQHTRADAEKEYTEAIRLQEGLVTEAPGDTEYPRELARTYYNRGIDRFAANSPDNARADFLKSISLLEPLVKVAEQAANKRINREPAQDLARVYNNYANVLARSKDADGARQYYDESITLAEQLVSRQPENREYKAELSQYASNAARLLAEDGRTELADPYSKRALDLLEELSKPNPTIMLSLVKALQMRGELMCEKNPREGIILTDRAFSILTDLDKDGSRKAGSLDAIYANIGVNYLELGESAFASHDTNTARAALSRLEETLPHLSQTERISMNGPYEQLHAALFKGSSR